MVYIEYQSVCPFVGIGSPPSLTPKKVLPVPSSELGPPLSHPKGVLPVPSSELGTPPPAPQASASPHLDPKGGDQHSLAGEGVGVPIRTAGKKAWHSVHMSITFLTVPTIC